MGTKGELKGDMEAGTIEIIDFVSGTNDLIQLHTPSKGHSGSDMSMMREFVRMVGEGKRENGCISFCGESSDGACS